jgi:hypothetical protein
VAVVSATVDVLPVADVVDHTAADGCLCGPEIVPVERPDGSIGFIARHHSLDGRERSDADHDWLAEERAE